CMVGEVGGDGGAVVVDEVGQSTRVGEGGQAPGEPPSLEEEVVLPEREGVSAREVLGAEQPQNALEVEAARVGQGEHLAVVHGQEAAPLGAAVLELVDAGHRCLSWEWLRPAPD